jgi:glycine cleavage system H lipoate-binding protein
MLILILVAFVVLCFTIDAIVRYSRREKSKASTTTEVHNQILNEASISIPKGLYFDKTHTWAYMEKNGEVKIGIDDFLLHVTGALSRVKMRNIGEQIQKGEPILTIIRFGKQLTINSPISGTITSHNIQLVKNPATVNLSPYNDGWVYLIEPTNWLRDSQFLIMADKYKDWLKNEFTRLKDFLSIVSQPGNEELMPVLQDGGELKDNLLEDLGPEVWEEFQIKFMNTSKYDFGKSDSTFTIINI